MKKSRWVVVASLLAVIALAGLTSAIQAASGPSAGATRPQIALNGSADFPDANGKARFEDRGGEQRFRVELQDALALAQQTVDVCVDGSLAGTATIDALGDGRLALNSALGDTVPAVDTSPPGSTVAVFTDAATDCGGTPVASGTF